MCVQFTVLIEYRSTSNGFLIHLHLKGGGNLSGFVPNINKIWLSAVLMGNTRWKIRDGRNMFEVLITMTVEIIVCWNVLIYQTARCNIPDDIFFME